MGSGRIPADGALEAELTALRARAYGVDADIDADPVALARLAELEELHAASAARAGQAPDGAESSSARDPARGERLGSPRRSRPWRGSRKAAFVAGAAIATGVALAVAGWMVWTAPRPDAVLQATEGRPSEQVLRLTDYARRQMVDKSTLRAFEPILGLEVWSARSGLGNDCLLVIEPVTDDLLAAGCVPAPAQPTVEIYNVPVAWMQTWTQELPTGSVLRFVRNGDTVEVWIYEGRPS
ncbi:hypothetical protein [Microbacterium sp. E-13]|uniref:hypothetical protein n=1 Tax=Microbacterium sp. E-13 TaxID=3404048 RepID=UPI003CF487A5